MDLPDLKKKEYRKIIHIDNNVHIPCYDNPLKTMRPLRQIASPQKLTLTGCRLPKMPLVDKLRALNISVAKLDTLLILKMKAYSLHWVTFQNLSISSLIIDYQQSQSSHSPFELFNSLASLTNLELKNNLLQPLPHFSKIISLTLQNSGFVSSLGLGDCRELVKLVIQGKFHPVNMSFLKNCTKLDELMILEWNVTQSQLKALGSGISKIRELVIAYTEELDNFTTPFSKAKELRKLALNNNKLSYIDL